MTLFAAVERTIILWRISKMSSINQLVYQQKIYQQLFWQTAKGNFKQIPLILQHKILICEDWLLSCRMWGNLKQHNVTLNATRGFEKRNETMHVNMSHKTAILEKSGYILWRKCRLVSLWCPKTSLSVCSLLFSRAVPNNDPLLQLQFQSSDSLHVAFRNLCESQSWGRAVAGHYRENQRTFPP